MRKRIRIPALILGGVCIGFVTWFGFLNHFTNASPQTQQRPLLKKLPPVKNCVEHIKIVSAELRMRGDFQVASIEVENQAYVGVISISIEQMVDKAKQAAAHSGFTADKAPLIIIAPGQRRVLTLENLGEKSPIVIGGAMFSDGTEEGCEPTLKYMREFRKSDEKKGEPK